MKTVKELHKKAMDIAEQAFIEKNKGNQKTADKLFRKSFKYEAEAAYLVPKDICSEPSRSVLYRSAGSLALNCNEFREAERLIAEGLAGFPPEEIAQELRDLLEKIYTNKSLKSEYDHLTKINIDVESAFLEKINEMAKRFDLNRNQLICNFLENAYEEAIILETIGLIPALKIMKKFKQSLNQSLKDGKINLNE